MVNNADFVHLHNHTCISVQDALPQPGGLAKKAREMGFPAVAVTDHGRMGACVEFADACRKPDADLPTIKPILGLEAYTCPDRLVKAQVVRPDGTTGRPKHNHLTLLAQDAIGYRNLLQMSSIGASEGYYYDPRIDRSVIEAHAEGVIALSGCLGSETSQALLRGDDAGAEETMRWFKERLPERYFIELQYHGIPEQAEIVPKLVALAKKLDLPIVCSNDVHYLAPEDWKVHDVLIQMRDLKDDKIRGNKNGKKEAYGSHQFYLKRAEEMHNTFASIAPDALKNTLMLAERVEDHLKLDVPHLLPAANIPTDDLAFIAFHQGKLPHYKRNEAYLAYLAVEGLKRLGLDNLRYNARLFKEWTSVVNMGVTDYFLIQHEMCQFMKGQDILYGIRGSGVGSLLNYCLSVCSVDPIRWNLLFERFLNPGRGTQYKVSYECSPWKQWVAENGKVDQAAAAKRLYALLGEKKIDPQYERFSADFDKEVWVLENQGQAAYLCDVADQGLSSEGNDCQLWSAYFLGVAKKAPENCLVVSRVATLPDVDTDIDDSRRGEVIQWARQRFGEDRVAMIGTRGTYQAKAAVLGALKVSQKFKDEFGEENVHRMALVITKSIPIRQQPPMTIEDALVESEDFARWARRFPEEIDVAAKLVGTISHMGIHAGGVLVSSEPISSVAPLENSKGVLASAYDMSSVERVGLVKYDYLGLATYQMLSLALNLIKKRHGKTIDLEKIDLDDPKVLKLYSQGRTATVFQFASGGMQKALQQVGVDSIEDLIAVAALYRPGPMANIEVYAKGKHDPESITYPHPIAEKIMAATNGVPVYQEQAMFLAREMAGFDWDDTDKMRKSVSKKDPVLFAKVSKMFREKAIARGIDEVVVDGTLKLIEGFSGYAFNRSHAASYAILSFWTAYLRVYYPAEWIAACMHVDRDDENKISIFRSEATSAKVTVVMPTINESGLETLVSRDGRILLPLTVIKGVGSATMPLIAAQPYDDFQDFVFRGRPNRGLAEALAGGGAFDCFHATYHVPVDRIMQKFDDLVIQRNREEKDAARLSKQKCVVKSPLVGRSGDTCDDGGAPAAFRSNPRQPAPERPRVRGLRVANANIFALLDKSKTGNLGVHGKDS